MKEKASYIVSTHADTVVHLNRKDTCRPDDNAPIKSHSDNADVAVDCSKIVGVGLPVYSSFKAIETKDETEKEEWLIYWSGEDSCQCANVFVMLYLKKTKTKTKKTCYLCMEYVVCIVQCFMSDSCH